MSGTDTELSLTKAVITALAANSTINTAVGGRIYTNVPQNTTFPYIAIRVNSEPFDTKEDTGMQHTLDVRVFGRIHGSKETAGISANIYALLNRGESSLTLESGTLVSMLFTGPGFTEQEPDGITWQSFRRYSAIVD